MKKVIFAAMLCMAIFTACSDNNSSEFPEKGQAQTTTAVTTTKAFHAEHSVTFTPNDLDKIQLKDDFTKNMEYYNVYDSQNINVEYEFAIPENYYSKTKIKVEW